MMLRTAILCALLFAAPAAQAQDLGAALLGGRPTIDLRLRYEMVSDKSRPMMGEGATLRARLGYDTARWNGLALQVAFDALVPVGDSDYNTTRNGKIAYSNIGDAELFALKHLNLSYNNAELATTIIAGRQRLALGSQRFLASPDWRMHGQSFDAVQLTNTSMPGLALTYIWINRVNRIYGETTPFDPAAVAAATNQAGHFKSESHVMNAAYTGLPGLKLEAYALLLDLAPPDTAFRPAQLAAAARLSTATLGARAEYDTRLWDTIGIRLIGDYARQSDHAANPLNVGLDYWLGEGGVSWNGFGAALGYEVLSGNGVVSVGTPIGWLHNNNGWADLFTTTPLNGLKDLYVRGTYVWPGFLGLRALNLMLRYHDFKTENLDRGIGSEWNLQADFQIDANFAVMAKYANHAGSGVGLGGFADKSVFWLQTSYRY